MVGTEAAGAGVTTAAEDSVDEVSTAAVTFTVDSAEMADFTAATLSMEEADSMAMAGPIASVAADSTVVAASMVEAAFTAADAGKFHT